MTEWVNRLKRLGTLRFRFIVSFVFAFGLLLIGIGFAFQHGVGQLLDERAHVIVEDEWNAARGFIRIERGQVNWTVDPREVDQTAFVERLRRFVLIADGQGNILETSNSYRLYGVEKTADIRSWFRGEGPQWKTLVHGQNRVLVRFGIFRSAGQPYLLAIGRGLGEARALPDLLLSYYFSLLPIFLLIAGGLGWLLARSALEPFNDLASTAQRISGSNLHLRIPEREVDDELGRLIVAFNKMMERLSENFEQVRRFSTDVSHELRTPLTAIRGQLEVGLMTAVTADDYKEAIITALQDVDRISNIVRALLLLSQAETGQLALNCKVLDLSPMVRELSEQFGSVAKDKRQRLVCRAPEPVYVSADMVQMERLVTNLLSNACKYTGEGGEIVISLEAPQRGGEAGGAILTVADTGRGIPAESLPYIFDRFYRVPGLPPDQGLGLGLSFVAWIVRAHRAQIHVSSKPGQGTTFVIEFPPIVLDHEPGRPTWEPVAEARQ